MKEKPADDEISHGRVGIIVLFTLHYHFFVSSVVLLHSYFMYYHFVTFSTGLFNRINVEFTRDCCILNRNSGGKSAQSDRDTVGIGKDTEYTEMGPVHSSFSVIFNRKMPFFAQFTKK